MFSQYKDYLKLIARSRIPASPENPSKTLAIGADEYHNNIGLFIYKEARQPIQLAQTVPVYQQSYETLSVPGSNDTLNILSFSPEAFTLGNPYGGV